VSGSELRLIDIDLLLTMDPEQGEGPLGALRDAAVVVRGGVIEWIGASAHAPDCATTVSARGAVVLPGLIDCHTHAVWAGSRADEFRRRQAGESYTAILEGGGGILSTVRAVRACPYEDLVAAGAARLSRLAAAGVTTVEVKSGYGLAPGPELALLRAAREAGERAGVRVIRTFLGAHTVPAELRHDRAAYVRQVIEDQLPICAPEADAIDVYIDRGAFTLEEGERILRAGAARGLAIRVHAEQVAFTGAAAMAAGLGALSADHLERIDEVGIAALAAAGTVAVMLPGSMLYLHDAPPPVAALREAGVRFAVATDWNPGTSPVGDLWLAGTLACVTMGLTVEEVLLGMTVNAARAIGRPELGVVRVGAPGDLVVMEPPAGEAPSAGALVQSLGVVRPRLVVRGGGISRPSPSPSPAS
jgi:imidazolonepropionase